MNLIHMQWLVRNSISYQYYLSNNEPQPDIDSFAMWTTETYSEFNAIANNLG